MANIHKDAWVHKSAVVHGDVTLGAYSNVWYNAAIRGVGMKIIIGEYSNVQDCVSVHGDIGTVLTIGDYVSLGHGCVVHGCTIENNCVIGMNAVVLDGAHIGEGSIVGAGAVVPTGMQVPPNSLVLGMPAKVKRTLSPEEVAHNVENAKEYLLFTEAAKAEEKA